MKIDPVLAQSIVNKMMAQIPYNVNMMDEHGYVIASGDETRINTLHVGALDAIEQKKTLPMAKSFGQHGQPGINMPIFFDKAIVGVIGITGDPEKVTPLASLLRVATELLLSQNQNNLREKKKETALNRFLYQWSQVTDHIENKTDLLLEASQLSIDILKERTAIAVQLKALPMNLLDPTDFQISLSANTVIVLTLQSVTIDRFTSYCQKKKIGLGIGLPNANIGVSVNQALQTLRISNVFNRPDQINYGQVAFIDTLLSSHLSLTPIVEKFQDANGSESGSDLIQTLGMYIRHSGNMVQTAKAMHIHRNTLGYRLSKIKEDFDLDPHNTIELFELYLGYLYFKDASYHHNLKNPATSGVN
ncbi:CdaR family transcriptional regulator [Levilactobacillus andaensis]|uniref:CdaR family transcriptional regulator n=1 Tax=Levilactobacillus andaensis TaxID=2799570 RepID=UPI0019411712|nr:sugar diacid recognition domain-containing protein [Levilactobacillus andaensis]